ncbi:MAG: NADH-quinone oxidoreductase subunit N [Armatimonadota bacterium]
MNPLGSMAAPMIATAVATVAVMLIIGTHRSHRMTVFVTLIGLLTALLLVLLAWPLPDRPAPPLLVLDHYALFYHGLFLLVALVLTLLGYGYLERHETHREEYYLLLLLATVGSMTLVASTHFASFFLGLEILSLSLYALIAFREARAAGVEAALKYLILAGLTSAFLLLGMALLYSQLGTMSLSGVAKALSQPFSPVQLGGLLPIFVGIGFKLAVVPFHLWTPDVYEGAPAPVTAFIATVSKGAVLALLLRYASSLNITADHSLGQVVAGGAILSMSTGNLLALKQPDLKRLLAYSSIAQMGYLLITVLLTDPVGATVATFYLITYFAATIAAFGVITALANDAEEPGLLAEYAGLAWRRPWLAGLLTMALLSLAGLPLTAGFLGKFILVTAGVGAHLWALVIVLVVNSTISLYYYLRAVSALYVHTAAGIEAPATAALSGRLSVAAATTAALLALALVIIWLGVYPSPLLARIGEVGTSLR